MVSSIRWGRIALGILVVSMLVPAAAAAICVEGDCRNGKGRFQWDNGAAYSGEFKDGTFHGSGTYTFPNGAIYTGQWANDKKSGAGTYTWPDGKSYEGRWLDDRKEGYGVFKWPDGTTYKGDFKNDQRDGLGTYSWPNGASYEGEWTGGKKNGAGIYTQPDGSQVGGTWEADKQTARREVADVTAHLDTLRKEQAAAIAAAQAPAAAEPPPAPAATAAPPGEHAQSQAAADDKEATQTDTPADASAGLATAFRLAVIDTPMGRADKVSPLTKRALITRGDHQAAGAITVDIAPSGGKEKGYALKLALENQSKCHLDFDGFIRIDETVFPVVSWHGDQAVAPGDTRQATVEIPVGSDLFGEDVNFKGQGFADHCAK